MTETDEKRLIYTRGGAEAADGEALPKFRVRGLDLFYGTFQALKGVDMDIEKNEITALIGPSGCGKSTFLKTLNRMNDLIAGCRISGEVLLDGTDIYKDTDVNALRKRVGMVFQKPNPFPSSVYDNIAYGPKTHGVRKKSELDEIVENSLRRAAIWDEVKDRLKKSALGLSGGQQQRLCIARALAASPELLLMDEPYGQMDVKMRFYLEDEVIRLWKELGSTVVFITHNIEEAVYLAERVLILSNKPAKIKEEVRIDLPRPRDITSSQFIQYRNYITDKIKWW